MTTWARRAILIFCLFVAGAAAAIVTGYIGWAWAAGSATAVLGSILIQTFIWKPRRPPE